MAIEILMPALSPTMEEGTLAKWLIKEGDVVEIGDLLAEIETDKATMEFEAVDEGVISKILVADGTEGVLVNTPICILLEDGEDVSSTVEFPVPKIQEADVIPKSEPSMSSSRTATKKDGNRLFSSPLARRIAEKRGLDITSLEGSGPRGRIVKADVENAHWQPSETPRLRAN